jgi:hypothetical protein
MRFLAGLFVAGLLGLSGIAGGCGSNGDECNEEDEICFDDEDCCGPLVCDTGTCEFPLLTATPR